jgi:Tol biopolymer transport system component
LDEGPDISVYEIRRDIMTRLTSGGGSSPVWSPDGRYIVYEGSDRNLWWVRSDGAGTPKPLVQSRNPMIPKSFTTDGKRLAYQEVDPQTLNDIWTVSIESDGAGLRARKPESFLQTPAGEVGPAFSPDGRWLAYHSNELGASQVYVRAFSDQSRPDKGAKWQISNTGGTFPVWSGNGHELFFRGADNRIMVIAYKTTADSFVPDRPRVWSEKRLGNFSRYNNYDLAPDGKRVAVLIPAETSEAQQAQNHMTFLLNFADELQRTVRAEK